jgi:hypothetical protein
MASLFPEKSEEFKKQLLDEMSFFEDFFYRNFAITIYLNYGTLLGAIREANFAGTDHDIDISYLSLVHTASDVIKEMKMIYNVLAENKLLKRTWKNHGQAHITFTNEEQMIDLFTSWIDIDNNYWTCQWGTPGKSDIILPFKRAKFADREFFVPNKSEEILSYLYGCDWKTPKNEHPSNYLQRIWWLDRILEKEKNAKI